MGDEYKIVHSWVNTFRKNKDRWVGELERLGADYTWMSLPDMGIKGNSHMLMMDNNSADIAAMIVDWLARKGLGANN